MIFLGEHHQRYCAITVDLAERSTHFSTLINSVFQARDAGRTCLVHFARDVNPQNTSLLLKEQVNKEAS